MRSPYSIASRIVLTPRWQELGPTCLLQLLIPEPSEPHRNPKPSKPSEPIKTRNSKTFETADIFWTGTCKNTSKPGTTFGTQNLSEPIETSNHLLSIKTWNRIGTGSRNPVPGTRFPGTAPACPEHTEIYIAQRPHSILLLGKIHTCKKAKTK